MNNVTVYKRTSSDWYPSFKIADYFETLVLVSFLKILDSNEWRVCAWGNDDYGLEKDFDDEKEAWTCFLEVIGLKDVTIAELINRGFVGAV